MNPLKLFPTGLAVVLALAWMTQAQPREERRPGEPNLLPPGVLARLDLSAEQKEKIDKLQLEFKEKLDSAKNKLDVAIEEARQNQDRQKAQEAQETFRKEIGPIRQAFGEKLAQVLSEEQRRRLSQLNSRQPGGPPFDLPRILGQLDLKAEQKEKVDKFMKEFGEKHELAKKNLADAIEQAKQNQDREKVRELLQAHEKEMAKLHENVLGNVQSVLTEAQKLRFAEIQRRRPDGPPPAAFGQVLPPPLQERLGLTPEQREKLGKLQRETEARLREILNDDQNRQLDELKKGGAPERPKQRK